jgi:transposase
MKTSNKSKKRRHYDAEFKSDLLKMHESGRSVSSLAESFGINENLIYRWKSAAKVSSKQADGSVVEENRRLHREVQELQRERDILKKALAIFSRHP